MTIRISLLGACIICLAAPATRAEEIVPESLPSIDARLRDQIVVEQAVATGRTHVRWTGTHYYSAVQSFEWTSDSPMSGVGILLADAGNGFRSPLAFELGIFEVSGVEQGAKVVSTIGTYDFSVSGKPETFRKHYLYLKLPKPLRLEKDLAYAFAITPRHTEDLLLTVCTSNGQDAGPSGWGGIFPSVKAGLPASITGTAVGDFAFFLTKSANP